MSYIDLSKILEKDTIFIQLVKDMKEDEDCPEIYEYVEDTYNKNNLFDDQEIGNAIDQAIIGIS